MVEGEKDPREQYANWKAPEEEGANQTLLPLEQRLTSLRDFKPSGDIRKDFNTMLILSDRKNLYKEVTEHDEPEVVLAGLTAIRDAWQSTVRNPDSIDQNNPAQRIFYVDLPKQEIASINQLINYYLEQLSKKKLQS